MRTFLKERSSSIWFSALLIEVLWNCIERRSYCHYHLFLLLIAVISWGSLQGFVPDEVHWNISRVLTFIPRYFRVLRNTSSALGQEEYNSIRSRGIQRGILFQAYQSLVFPSKGSLPDAPKSQYYGMGFWEKNFISRWSGKKTWGGALKSVSSTQKLG